MVGAVVLVVLVVVVGRGGRGGRGGRVVVVWWSCGSRVVVV